MKLAKSLVKFPQSAMIMDKMAAVNSTLDPSSMDSMRDETVRLSLLGQAIEDMKEGVDKFQGGRFFTEKMLQKRNIGNILIAEGF